MGLGYCRNKKVPILIKYEVTMLVFLTIRLPLETEEGRIKLGPKEGGRGS